MDKFTIHTVQTAPEKSREILNAVQNKFGFIPNVIGEMAESPALLRGYNELSVATTSGIFSPTELQVIQITVSSMNNSSYCIAANTTIAEKSGVPRDVLDSLRREKPLKDPKLEALRVYTQTAMKKLGWAEERDLTAFYKAGYTRAHALEVVLNLSLKMLTNYVNHVAGTPLDKAFEPNRIEDRKPGERSTHAA
ncbi:MAG: carboxymuconolactone decarboxylase family protein [Proteobacteria bacterium]|nr:carboxymuconolactone decarboxylase family protein [Pseudomonadota bacterium]